MKCTLPLVGWIAISSAVWASGQAPIQLLHVAAPVSSSATDQHRALLNQYCVSCHNERAKVAGLVLDKIDLTKVSGGAPIWEKVIRKLRTGAMPPDGRPQPHDAASHALVSWLEIELDRAARANPNPGTRPALHRLSRTEYHHAIRDLLALEALPRELDVTLLLPADNAVGGFDNVAELLFVSPTALEAYLAAARKISRLAIGDPSMPQIADIYTLPYQLPQDRQFEELPFGTRGGTAIRTYFPLDGEYLVTIEPSARPRDKHQIEVTLDGERVELFTIGDEAARAEMQPFDDAPAKLETRVAVHAGPHIVGVAFLAKTSARPESIIRPFTRGRGQQPAIETVSIIGPVAAAGVSDTPVRRRIFVCRPVAPSEELPCAKLILSTLARRAFRRPTTDEDLARLLPFYTQGRAERGFESGIQRALERILVSPQFLFRIERTPANADAGKSYRISDLELASRLSFFLWSSIPDDELIDLAARGKLSNAVNLERQVRRMLADQRSSALVNNFAAQWLFLRDLDSKSPDSRSFPDFDDGLRHALRRETELFFESIMREDRSVLDLLRADYTFINERLARHYGIANIYGSHFRRVKVSPATGRGGLLGHGSILTLSSYPTRTSPVLRGKWVLENILSAPPPPPPPNVPGLPKERTSEGKTLSMRERMVAHRVNPVCASCHARMDPLGFALENFDAVGRWRTRDESGKPVDVAGALPNGIRFEGVIGLKAELSRQPEEFALTVTEKLLEYAVARGLDFYDAPAVRSIVRNAARDDYRMSSVILSIVRSTPFQLRQPES